MPARSWPPATPLTRAPSRRGELFFAVRGERLDGHDFVAAAFDRGAVAAVVSRARAASLPDAALAHPLLIAEDPLAAMQSLARMCAANGAAASSPSPAQPEKPPPRKPSPPRSGAKFSVLKSQGNLNNDFGLPLQLLRLMPEHEFAVVEMGMNHSGEIAALARIAAPDWGVITNIGTAHIENFAEGQAGIARAKFELIASLPANGVAFLNCDDAYAAQFGRDFSGRVVYFGSRPLRRSANSRRPSKISTACTSASAPASAKPTSLCSCLVRTTRSNAVAGLAVALEAGVDLDAAVAAHRFAHRRRQARPGHRNRRRNHPQRQLQLQPRGAPLHDSHARRASRCGPPHPCRRRDA